MGKNKKNHDQTVYDSHEGFRDGVRKYSYSYEYQGKIIYHTYSSFDFALKEKEFFNHPSGYFSIRRIQTNWMYGTKLILVHLEKAKEQNV
jgi:hypothetical protein